MLFISLLSSLVLAVPQQFSQQGRLIDSSGSAINGTEALTFRVFDEETGGSLLWEEVLVVEFVNGYYATVLGANSINPLDDSILSLGPLWLEVEVNNNNPLSPRQRLSSTPYARRSNSAINVDGGTVNSAEIQINGSVVIDSTGSWVGPTISMNWTDILNIPSDIADGDNDTLAGLNCAPEQIVGWDGGNWICTDDNGLTELEVENYITNSAIDLAAGSTVGSDLIVTSSTDQDTVRDLNCQNGDIPKWDAFLGQWGCDIDNADWSVLTNIPADIADGDDKLSESEVEGFITNGGINLDASSTIGGKTFLTSSNCNNGEFLTYNNGNWSCTSLNNVLDADGDGSLAWDDCDDNDASIGSNTNDKDCDGNNSTIDCDDFDANSETTLTDGDCDGVLTADDCNDSNDGLLAQANDQDCDGHLTADDCDDNDPFSTVTIQDLDCDGFITSLDCDDTDNSVGSNVNDADCDGSPSADDCDDNDPNIYDCLFLFTSHEFTSCGVTGRYGPTRSQCRSSYSPNQAWDEDSLFFDMSTQGIQEWTIPADGTYQIIAKGAAGSDSQSYGRNYGASMQGNFNLTKGDVLLIIVGQSGEGNSSNHANEQGGGGGSFVVMGSTPLIIAGGGGGTAGVSGGCSQVRGHGNTSEEGDSVNCSGTGSGGSGGHGGSTSGSYQGAAGGGYYSDGSNGSSHCETPTGGLSFLNGGIGGYGKGCYDPAANGGFGGGGGGGLGSPGGGGGYSGGGASGNWSSSTNHGGGGGSYNSGSSQSNSVMSGATGYGPTNYDGVVIINKL